jgi:predicted dehydrogenase/threonine dehydrogenase-like Zn-dependent dehydrogenase
MKQVFRTQQGIVVENVPVPSFGDNDILVKVYRSMISTGTETKTAAKAKSGLLKKIHNHQKNIQKLNKMIKLNGLSSTYKLIRQKVNPAEEDLNMASIGYSVAGVVIATGQKIQSFKVGDRVACAGSGFASHAEYVAIPKNLAVHIPDNVSFEKAAFTTIGSIALQGVRRANITFGDTIVITGLGLIGLLGVQIAKSWGLRVIAIDIDESRMEIARKLGADYAYNANEPEIISLISSVTDGLGVDAVVICAATMSSNPVNQAMKFCRRKGTVVIVGAVGMNVERDEMYFKEIDLVMSTSYGPGRYDDQYEKKGIDYPIGYVKWTENRNMIEFVRLLSLGKIQTDNLINKSFKIEDARKAFDFLSSSAQKPIGAILEYNDELLKDNSIGEMFYNVRYKKNEGSKIKVGIVGTGGFIQGNHLPNLHELKEMYQIHAICDRNHVTAANLAKRYNAQYCTTDYVNILNDKEIDVVIIGTRHNLHAQIAIESLTAGKNVLVEKPAAMTLDELNELDKVVRKSDKTITAGFNRRYSPFAIQAKEIFQNRLSPLVVTYRVNAGAYPLSNWIHDPIEGGGRIIGEACHFIDFVSFVIDKPLIDYTFNFIPVDNKMVYANDNVSVNMLFSDGSIANMVYTSIGSKQLEKERIEIFGDMKSLVIDNFVQSNAYGVNSKNIKLKKMDKGFKQELLDFALVLQGKKPLTLSWDSIFQTTKLTIEIMNKILGNAND